MTRPAPSVALFDAYPYAVGGAHRVLALLAEGFRSRGSDVTVLLPAEGVTAAWFRDRGLRVDVLPAPPRLLEYGGITPLTAAKNLPRYWMALRRYVRGRDVLWVNDLRGLLLAGPVGRTSRTAVIWHVHARPPHLAGLHRRLTRLVQQVIVPSRALAEDLSIPRRAIVLRNAVYPRATGAPASGPPCVLCIARLDPTKGLDVLLRAHARLTSPLGPVELVVAGAEQPGREGERARLLALATELGTRDRIHLPGEVEDVYALHARAHVYAQPSRQESFGLAALEAMASGLPVVVSDAGGLPELVGNGDAGLVVPADDDAALSAALQRLLDDADLRTALGGRARTRARTDHDPAAFVEHAFELCAEVLPR